MGATGTAPARLKEHYEVPVWLQEMPKTDFHCHLGGSLRLRTMLEFQDNYGVEWEARFNIPRSDLSEEGLRKHVIYRERQAGKAKSLAEYLNCFPICESVLVKPEAFSRAAYEVCEDAHNEGVNVFELRFGPTRYLPKENGSTLNPYEIMEATLDGLSRARDDFKMHTGLIVCGIRTDFEATKQAVNMAVNYKHRGVVGFDLAGKERGHRPKDFEEIIMPVLMNFIPVTVHAGEDDTVASIAEALIYLNARRLGHAIALCQSRDLAEWVDTTNTGIEVCMTSNEDTGAVASIKTHPLRTNYLDGLRVSLHTDNRTISDTTVTAEYMHAIRHLGFGMKDVFNLQRNGYKSAFLDSRTRREYLDLLDDYAAKHGVALSRTNGY